MTERYDVDTMFGGTADTRADEVISSCRGVAYKDWGCRVCGHIFSDEEPYVHINGFILCGPCFKRIADTIIDEKQHWAALRIRHALT